MNELIPREAIPYVPEADSFHFGGALAAMAQAVRTHWLAVVATMVVACGLVGLYVWVWPPVYESEVMVALDSDKDVQRTAFYQGWNTFRKEGLVDEGVLMTSQPVLQEVVTQLHLKYEDVYHPFLRYAIHLWTESWLGKNWRRFKHWLLRTPESTSLLSPEEIELGRVLSDMQSGVAIHQLGEASIGSLAVKASTPRVADIANAIVRVYLRQRQERYVTEATEAYESLASEAAKTRAELDALGRRIREFRARTGTVLLFEKDRGQIGQWITLRSSIDDLRVTISENEASLKAIEAQLGHESANLRSDTVYKVDAQKARLPQLEQALAAARENYQPTSREVRDLEEQIAKAQEVIAGGAPTIVRNSARMSENYEQLLAKKRSIEAALAGARSALAVREQELSRMTDLLDRIPASMQANHELEVEQQTLESKYSGIYAKLAVAAVSMATAKSAPPAMRVVETAHPPEQASAPQTKLLLAAAALAGLVVGALLALMLDLQTPRVTRARLASPYGGARLLGVVVIDLGRLQALLAAPSAPLLGET